MAAVASVHLTPGELKAAHDLLTGLTVTEIARRDWVTYETVKWHRKNLYRKLGLPKNPSLAGHAQHREAVRAFLEMYEEAA